MKTMNIFKTVALAMLMPAMLLTTACSSDDDLVNNAANTETVANKGYALPVTVNVTREGDKGSNRASYTDNGDKTGSLAFSAGDKLFVTGNHAEAGNFAGTLDYDAVSKKFSGTMTTQNKYTGTIDDLMASAAAFLLPAGYESYGFNSIKGNGYNAMISFDFEKAFALTKAAAVEQFSYEFADSYNSGFALAPMNAIASFTISGLTANKEVAVSFDAGVAGVIGGNVTTSAEGVATFAVGVFPGKLEDCTLTVGGNNIAMPTKTTEAGHIYNISRSVAPAATDLSTLTDDYEAQDGETLTGTLSSNVKISIADGATVTLKDVTINGVNDTSYKWAGITCAGDATIILNGTNTVTGFSERYPGIFVSSGKTLVINGTGELNASSNGSYDNGSGGAGIGGGNGMNCGNIEIQSGTVTATGKENGAGIGGGYNANCGNITISGGTVTATGGYRAAGIGGGKRQSTSSCGNITISGGTIIATGGEDAAGIGGGRGNGAVSKSSCGTITITSGVTSVTATKGSDDAQSIGAGRYGDCGAVTIEDPSKVTQN